MSKFKLEAKKFSLDFIGDNWKDCYLEFKPLTYGEVNKFVSLSFDGNDQGDIAKSTAEVFEVLKKKFVSGKGIDINDKEMKITANDLEDLPIDVITKAIGFLSATEAPNV